MSEFMEIVGANAQLSAAIGDMLLGDVDDEEVLDHEFAQSCIELLGVFEDAKLCKVVKPEYLLEGATENSLQLLWYEAMREAEADTGDEEGQTDRE